MKGLQKTFHPAFPSEADVMRMGVRVAGMEKSRSVLSCLANCSRACVCLPQLLNICQSRVLKYEWCQRENMPPLLKLSLLPQPPIKSFSPSQIFHSFLNGQFPQELASHK